MRSIEFVMVPLVIVFTLCGCGPGVSPIKEQNIQRIEFEPTMGERLTITNKAEIVMIGKWLNDSMQHPISQFSPRSYPKPGHKLIFTVIDGPPVTVLVSGGRADSFDSARQMAVRLTVISIDGKEFMSEACPRSVLFPPQE
jgi:hypothetical protein